MPMQANRGYNGWSMSLRAIEAYKDGLMPASKIPGGIPSALIKRFCDAVEWHHSSKYFNEVYFYDSHKVRVSFGLEEPTSNEDIVPNPDAIKALMDWKQSKNQKPPSISHALWSGWNGRGRATTRDPLKNRLSIAAWLSKVKWPQSRFPQVRVLKKS